MTEDWHLLVSFLPADWRALAKETGALTGLRKDKSAENLLRVLLLYLGSERSLRETAVQARQANLADLSAVALWHRLKKSKEWMRALCIDLLRERGVDLSDSRGFQVRAVDAATVKEVGKTGSLRRFHYSLQLPSLDCDFFKATEMNSRGGGESLSDFSIAAGDHLLAGWSYSTAANIHCVAHAGGRVTVPLKTEAIVLRTHRDRPFDLLTALRSVRSAGAVHSWAVRSVDQKGGTVEGRVCAVRKSEEAVWLAQQSLRMEALRREVPVQSESLERGKYVIVFSTFPAADFTDADVLEWYRTGWQVAMALKRFKAIAQLGHLPKRDDESARAWLYGKLLVALLVEKLISHASATAPWGYRLAIPAVPRRPA